MIGSRTAYEVLARTVGRFCAQRGTRLTILMYHRIQDRPTRSAYVPTAVFRQHVAYLADNGYESIRLRQVQEGWPHVLTGRPKVVLTFDDLWASQVDECLPAMQEYGFVGTFFVPTGLIQDERYRPTALGPFESDLGRWSDVDTLVRHKMEIGVHTHTHPRMSTLNREQVETELRTSNAVLAQRLGNPAVSFAFPFGKPSTYAPWIVRMLPDYGYRVACTTQWGRPTAGSHLLELPRVAVDGGDDARRFVRKLRGHYDFLRWLRR